ncbi:MAG: efflux RND transporter permease subunit, partial [Candidatus Omnitrophica bacterium]|nr:efflux RND transporter permease subunit [Candidatus Omnitrophota bacterium]
SFKEITSVVRFKRSPGIMMMVQKQSGTNSVEVAGKVKKAVDEIAKNLPPDVKINTIFDTSQDIINSLNSLKTSVWLGIVLVIMVAWFFFRSFAPSLIIALTIPFSLLISFIYLFLSKGTINTISLSSLAIASGMVVDNAIVIVDNILRRLERGNRTTESAIFGASEMFLSVAASTLTTVVVFVPMLFIPGVVGIIFGGLAIIIIVTLTASLYTASTFTPMLASKWLRINKTGKKSKIFEKFYAVSERWFKGWENSYSRALGYALKHKKLILIGFLIVFISSLLLIPFIGSEFLPEEDSGDLRISVHLPIGTRIEESDKVAKKIEDILDINVPEAKYYYARVGQVTGVGRLMGGASGTHIVTAGGKLIPKDQRKRSVKEIGQLVRNKIRQIPGVLRTDITTGNPLSNLITGGGGKSVELEIIGNSFEDTNALAQRIKEIMEKIPGAVDVSISREANSPELKIDVDREKAASLGLDMSTIASSLKSFIQGTTATKYREKGRMYDIYVRLEESSRTKLEDIENLSIVAPLPQDNTPFIGLENLASNQGLSRNQIKLSNIAKIEETTGPDRIERKNRERMVRVQCNTYKRSSGKIVEDLSREISKLALPAGVTLNIGGDAEEQRKAFADMALLLVLGIALVYMVMAAQFESLLDPFIIMFAIPFTFIGVILGFALTGTTLSINTFLGIVMLMGIVVNNAIVLISYIIMLRARGLSMYDAVTLAGHDRLRPVLMTTVTTIAGLLPLALSRGEGSEVWQPLGITMIGGLTVSTLVTLLFVPTLYAVFHRKQGLPGGNKK